LWIFNGYGDMVIMSIQMFEEYMYLHDLYKNLEKSEADVSAGRVKNARKSLKSIREKHGV